MNQIYFILLFIHILLCLFTLIGVLTGFLKVHKYMFFVVLCLPFWGFLTVILLHFQVLFKQDETIEVGVAKMKLDSVLYKGITVAADNNDDSVVPMEEALIINSPKERREIIMDVLNDDPREYIEFLQKAGNNEDTEVVHYAVTAMVEISKENDYMLQKLARKYSKEPDSLEVITEYTDFLWTVLNQGMLQGQVEIMNRTLFSQLISKKLGLKDSLTDYARYIENEFALGNYTLAGEILSKAEGLYRDEEEIILLKLKYYAFMKKGQEIQALINDLQDRKVFVTQRVKEAMAFWKD